MSERSGDKRDEVAKLADLIESDDLGGRTIDLNPDERWTIVLALRAYGLPNTPQGQASPRSQGGDVPARETVAGLPAAPSSTREITDDEIVRALRDATASDATWRELTREIGPYSITEPRAFTRDFVRLIVERFAPSATGTITSDEMYGLCLAIERLPASEQQTQVSEWASGLLAKLRRADGSAKEKP